MLSDLDKLINNIQNRNQEGYIVHNVQFTNYNCNDYNIPIRGDRHNYNFRYNFKLYNFRLITSYEMIILHHQLLNFPANQQIEDIDFEYMKRYIQQQEAYIAGLTTHERNIIKDYTNPFPFDFLKQYMINRVGFVNRYLDTIGRMPINTDMGNAFCDIIFDVCGARLGLTAADEDRIKNKTFSANADEIYNQIREDEWQEIFRIYLNQLNVIILGAPPVTQSFTCFRGSGDDYINANS
jgi:hypothetical protein